MKTANLEQVKHNGTGYVASLNHIYLGTFGSNIQALAAIRGAKAVLFHQKTTREARKLAKEDRVQSPAAAPEQLAKGIYRRGSRFIVSSPKYLGTFNDYTAALEARNAALNDTLNVRLSAVKPDLPFEDRTLKL